MLKKFEFKINGPIKGGKNSMKINRSGHHYPNPKWAEWRDQVVREIREVCKPTEDSMIKKPCSMHVIYTPYDLKRRDIPAMLDSIFHCLERSGIVTDDSLIKNVIWKQYLISTEFALNKENAGASIIIEEL